MSPFVSGYGAARAIYFVHNIGPNLQRYPLWLWQSQSLWIVVAAVAACVPPLSRHGGRAIALAAAMLAVTFLGYVAYAPYDQWWYLRFLLPGLGAFFALAAAGVVAIGRSSARRWSRVAAAVLLALVVWRSAAYAFALDMFGPFRESEHKYVDVGVFVARELPPDAVVFALQHSGTIRFYGGRHTLRYDQLDRRTAQIVLPEIERLGLHPYLAIEDPEIADVRQAFDLPPDRPLPWPYVARMDRFGGISILDLASHPSAAAPRPLPYGAGPRYMAPAAITIQPRRP